MFTIAIAQSKLAKTWKDTEATWEDFCQRLREPVRTAETVAEYRKFSKARRDSAKDVGGYVFGYLKDGRRKKDSVVYRQAVTLDADSPSDTFLDDVKKILGAYAYAWYTTHSSRKEAPRYRLVVPLSQRVEPEAYEAMARRIAKDIGMDNFDPTTFEPSRLMYWPSCPRDGEYAMDARQGAFLNPDEVLARYDNWKDASTWPMARSEIALIHGGKKQQDPTTKKGVIGAFCRAHTIEDAIETFLSDVYTPVDGMEGRYTYRKGSTSGGLVTYDGKFAYSHHATDPASGMDCNAFDLVRVHKFGPLDDACEEDTPIGKRPSFKAMQEFAAGDKATRIELGKSAIDSMQDSLIYDPEDFDWMGRIQRDRNGKTKPVAENAILILSYDPRLKKKFGMNRFSHRPSVLADLPWRKLEVSSVWTDSDDAGLRNFLSLKFQLQGRQIIDDALLQVMEDNAFHPVRDYLKGLTWDGVKRMDTIFSDYLGAEDSHYTRAVARSFLKAAVARVMRPGVKYDYCLILSGPQGIGKSTLLAKLGGEWFNDSLVSIGTKDTLEQLQGSWIIELAEMQATSKAENDALKAFITRQVDKFRKAYGRRTEAYPRQCVFAATTNDSEFLRDRTGGRRFLPVLVNGNGMLNAADMETDQIWAEAMAAYKKDSTLLLDAEARSMAAEMQDAVTEGSEKKGLIEDYLEKRFPECWQKMDLYDRKAYLDSYSEETAEGRPLDKVCVLQIWVEALGNRKDKFTSANSRELNAIMHRIKGWEPYKNGRGTLRFGNLYGVQKAYIRV